MEKPYMDVKAYLGGEFLPLQYRTVETGPFGLIAIMPKYAGQHK
jgi:hypothetical protein